MDPKVVRANHWKRMKSLSQSFYDAALKGDISLFKHLKNIGAPFCKIGPKKMNPLHAAAMNDHYDIAKVLINAGVDINETVKDGKTALHIAVIHGSIRVVHLLLSSGVTTDICDKTGMTPLMCAQENNNTDLVNMLQGKEATSWNNRDLRISEPDISESLEPSLSNNGDSAGDEPATPGCDETPFIDDDDDLIFVLDDISTDSMPTKLHTKLKEQEETETITNDAAFSYQEYVASHAEEDRLTEEKQNGILQQLDDLEKDNISVKSLDLDEEETETLSDLLRVQATIMTKEDASLLLLRLMGQGRTMQLTEAGRRAFELVKPDWMFKTEQKKSLDEEENPKEKKVSSALVLHRNSNSTSPTPDYLQELSQTLNTFNSTFKCRPRIDSSPPLKRCRV